MNEPLPEMILANTNSESQPKRPHDLSINVLGTSFSITAPEDPAYLNDVLSQYETALAYTQGISEIKDPLKVAILTGFLICDQFNKLKQHVKEEQEHAEAQRSSEERELNQILENLINRLDAIMKEAHLFDG